MKFVYSALLFLFFACSCIREIEAILVPVKNATNTEVVVAYFRQYYGQNSSFVQQSNPQTILPGQEITLGSPSVNFRYNAFVVGADKPEHLQQAADKRLGVLVLRAANQDRDLSCPIVIEKNELDELVLTCRK